MNFLHSFPICRQSSLKKMISLRESKFDVAHLVGVMIIAIGPSFSSRGSWSAMWRNRGRRKARVLPWETI